MVFTDIGIVMVERERQLLKAPSSIVVIDGGIVIELIDAWHSKALPSITVKSDAMTTSVASRGTLLTPS